VVETFEGPPMTRVTYSTERAQYRIYLRNCKPADLSDWLATLPVDAEVLQVGNGGRHQGMFI
jgi:hypothetical protein